MEEVSPIVIQCPYCGEAVEILVEPDLLGEMVYDCEVCCHPWQLSVLREGDGKRVEAARLDD